MDDKIEVTNTVASGEVLPEGNKKISEQKPVKKDYFRSNKHSVESVVAPKGIEFRNVTDRQISIDFADRTVVWTPFASNVLTPGEASSQRFKARINQFKECK